MESEEAIYIFADGHYLGQMQRVTYDMWYLEGRWKAADSVAGTHFTALMARQDLKHNVTAGVGKYVEYSPQDIDGKRSPAIAYGLLDDGLLLIRMLTHEKSVEIAKRNSL